MAGSGRWWWLAVVMLVASLSQPAFSDPQTNQIGDLGCGPYHVTDVPDYNRELNLSFADLRNQLSSANKRFAIATKPAVYAMVQCRKYLSTADCVACFDAAVLVTRNCPIAASSAIVMFDGCFLRYRNTYLYVQITDEITAGGTYRVCGNRTASKQDIFNAIAQELLNELLLATPRINGFYAAAKLREEPPSGGGSTTYAVAQCVETVNQSSCEDCLSLAYNNIKGCLPNSADGRAVDAGCFLRYSDTPFFADNQTTDIAPFLVRGSSGKKKPILLGSVVATVGIILVLGALFLLYRKSRKANAWRRAKKIYWVKEVLVMYIRAPYRTGKWWQ